MIAPLDLDPERPWSRQRIVELGTHDPPAPLPAARPAILRESSILARPGAELFGTTATGKGMTSIAVMSATLVKDPSSLVGVHRLSSADGVGYTWEPPSPRMSK